MERVVERHRQVDELRARPLVEHRAVGGRRVVAVPDERDFLAPLRLALGDHLLQRRAADEVVIEPDDATVVELVRREVVVLDVLRVEAAAERRGRLVGALGQPLSIRLHLLARVDRRQRARQPPGFERVRMVGAATDLNHAVLLPGLEQRRMNDVVVGPGPPHLQAGLPGHAVAQRPNLLACNLQARHVEEAQLRRLLARRLADDVHGAGTLDLVAVQDRIALAIERVVVAPDAHVVAARRRVIVQPVDRRRNADGLVLVLFEVEENVVADDVAVVVDGDELLGHVDGEFRNAVDGELADQLQRIGALDVQVGHVMRLVEQNRGPAPGQLLVAPVRELRHHARHDRRLSLRFPQQLDRAAGFLDRLFEILHHVALTPITQDTATPPAAQSRCRGRFYFMPLQRDLRFDARRPL